MILAKGNLRMKPPDGTMTCTEDMGTIVKQDIDDQWEEMDHLHHLHLEEEEEEEGEAMTVQTMRMRTLNVPHPHEMEDRGGHLQPSEE